MNPSFIPLCASQACESLLHIASSPCGRSLIAGFAIAFTVWPSNSITRWAIRRATSSRNKRADDDPTDQFHGGQWIGALERLLLLVLIITGNPGGFAAVIAAKGIIRFPEISRESEPENHQKAEVFLIGSFTSWLLALITGTVLQLIGITLPS